MGDTNFDSGFKLMYNVEVDLGHYLLYIQNHYRVIMLKKGFYPWSTVDNQTAYHPWKEFYWVYSVYNLLCFQKRQVNAYNFPIQTEKSYCSNKTWYVLWNVSTSI